jgi:hypothetical protein
MKKGIGYEHDLSARRIWIKNIAPPRNWLFKGDIGMKVLNRGFGNLEARLSLFAPA